ncbi:hypothetical protein RFI_18608, partial [Reticulomyxa filosa]
MQKKRTLLFFFCACSLYFVTHFLNRNNMGNQTHFTPLSTLPIPLYLGQCVAYKQEVLICGGVCKGDCYSYHTLKNEYKHVCSYPSDTKLFGHCVVRLANDNKDTDKDEVVLLSFGGERKHTLMMKYVSVWDETIEKSEHCNKWLPFTDMHNQVLCIGRSKDDYRGVRAVLGGSENHLLFITYFPNNIDVFDVTTFQYVKHDILPTDGNYWIWYHCFVSKSTNAKKDLKKRGTEMVLFCENRGLSIEYDEDNNTFRFRKLPVCDSISPLNKCAYVRIHDVILFFGGDSHRNGTSKAVHKYSIKDSKWITFPHSLPTPLYGCVAVLSEDDACVHILGGKNRQMEEVSTHTKANVHYWLSEKEMQRWRLLHAHNKNEKEEEEEEE